MSASQSRLDFILSLTDYFHGHWEDPEWGKLPTSQILVSLAIREFAAKLHDSDLRAQILTATDKAIAKSAHSAAKA